MKITAVIAEYNPFHRGHAYHLQQARRQTRADYMIAVMSGDYVQRGEPAIIDKYVRTHMALSCGADLVLELPVLYATASAELFAGGAISLINALQVADSVCFGTESGSPAVFNQIAQYLIDEPESYKQTLRMHLSAGSSYPAARMEALASCCAQTHLLPEADLRKLLSSPNNILGLEYCKAILTQHAALAPISIPRRGASYHDTHLSETYSSAAAIRKAMTSQPILDLSDAFPEEVFALLKETVHARGIISVEDYALLLNYRLMCEDAPSLTAYQDVSFDLANRIVDHLSSFSGYAAFVDLLKTRNLTRSRIARALLHILLNMTKQETSDPHKPVPYARILGFRKDAGPLLTQLKAHSNIPMITKVTQADTLLSEADAKMLKKDLWCANLYESVQSQKKGFPFAHEAKKQIVIV